MNNILMEQPKNDSESVLNDTLDGILPRFKWMSDERNQIRDRMKSEAKGVPKTPESFFGNFLQKITKNNPCTSIPLLHLKLRIDGTNTFIPTHKSRLSTSYCIQLR